MNPLPLSQWLDSAVQAAGEVATSLLGCSTLRLEPGNEARLCEVGSFVPMHLGEATVHLGIVADARACRRLAGQLLGMDADDIDEDDLADAVNEVTNVVAGTTLRLTARKGTGSDLGLPSFHRGRSPVSEPGLQSAFAQAYFDDIPACLVVYHRSENQ